jgi:hypothetical protein
MYTTLTPTLSPRRSQIGQNGTNIPVRSDSDSAPGHEVLKIFPSDPDLAPGSKPRAGQISGMKKALNNLLAHVSTIRDLFDAEIIVHRYLSLCRHFGQMWISTRFFIFFSRLKFAASKHVAK